MTGSGRGLQAVVLGSVAALIAALCAIVLIGIDLNRSAMLEAVGVATVPPRDPARANAKLKGNIARFFSSDNYPDEARDRGEQGLVRAKLAIAPTGRVVGCRIASTSGHESLDRATCQVVLDNARFEPARDRAGNAMSSTYMLAVRWQLPQP